MNLKTFLTRSIFSILTVVFLSGSSNVKHCTDSKAFSLFYGDIRQLAYDIVAEKKSAHKMNLTLQELNSKIGSTKVADWEFSDQVHRIITTNILESKRENLTDAEKSDFFNAALIKAYDFNLQYAAKNK